MVYLIEGWRVKKKNKTPNQEIRSTWCVWSTVWTEVLQRTEVFPSFSWWKGKITAGKIQKHFEIGKRCLCDWRKKHLLYLKWPSRLNFNSFFLGLTFPLSCSTNPSQMNVAALSTLWLGLKASSWPQLKAQVFAEVSEDFRCMRWLLTVCMFHQM